MAAMEKGKYTTGEAAVKAGIHLTTLQRWIAAEKIKAPNPVLIGGVGYRLWSEKDIEDLKKARDKIFYKGGGRKKKGGGK
jgi:DNA-binding transcriptional MerR regulator